jgi:hypothetical protein
VCTIAEQLKADATGDVAINIFVDAVTHAIETAPGLRWQPIADLLLWVYDFFPAVPYKEAVKEALAALRSSDPETAESILERAGSKRRGHPQKANIPAVKALIYSTYLSEYRVKRHGKSEPNWDKLAKDFYSDKANSLRITVLKLRAQMEASGMTLPPSSEIKYA